MNPWPPWGGKYGRGRHARVARPHDDQCSAARRTAAGPHPHSTANWPTVVLDRWSAGETTAVRGRTHGYRRRVSQCRSGSRAPSSRPVTVEVPLRSLADEVVNGRSHGGDAALALADDHREATAADVVELRFELRPVSERVRCAGLQMPGVAAPRGRRPVRLRHPARNGVTRQEVKCLADHPGAADRLLRVSDDDTQGRRCELARHSEPA